MTEAFFFPRPSGLTLSEIVELTGAKPQPGADLGRRIAGIAALDRAGPHDLCFLDSTKFAPQAALCEAGACLIDQSLAHVLPSGVSALYTREPYLAFVKTARALFPDALRPSSLFEAEGVAIGATVHPSARLEDGVTVDPGATIGPRAEIGGNTVIAAGAVIGPNVHIGRGCAIGAHASVMHALIGDHVIIHPGCRIGQDGFSYLMGAAGHLKIPQIGRVIIQDNVEIGANTTIDRGAMVDTVIGEGTKIDNLVQIAHNVLIGRHCVLVSQTGISGSTVLADYVVTGGQVGIADHVSIGAGAALAAKSGVMKDVEPGARMMGYPAKPARQFFREIAVLGKLARQGRKGPKGAESDS